MTLEQGDQQKPPLETLLMTDEAHSAGRRVTALCLTSVASIILGTAHDTQADVVVVRRLKGARFQTFPLHNTKIANFISDVRI